MLACMNSQVIHSSGRRLSLACYPPLLVLNLEKWSGKQREMLESTSVVREHPMLLWISGGPPCSILMTDCPYKYHTMNSIKSFKLAYNPANETNVFKHHYILSVIDTSWRPKQWIGEKKIKTLNQTDQENVCREMKSHIGRVQEWWRVIHNRDLLSRT